MRREAVAVAAVIVAVVGVLAPLTLAGRLASSADLDAFYAPFASVPARPAWRRGDLPYWAPGRVLGPAVPGRRAVGRDLPADAARLLAARPDRRAARGGDVPLPDRRARHLCARAAVAREPHRVGVRRDRVRGLGPPRRALGRARPARRRGLAGAGARARRGHRERAALAARARDGRALARARAAPRERVAAAGRALARDVRDLARRARGRARGCVRRRRASRSRSAWPPSRCCRGSSCCATRRRPGYVDPDGIGSLLFGDRRGLVGRFGVSHSEIATLYLGAATPALALIGLAPRRGGAPARAARLADRVLDRLGGRARRLADGSAAARAHRGRARAGARHRARAAVRERARRARAAGGRSAGPAPCGVAALGLLVGVLAGGSDGFALALPGAARRRSAPCSRCAASRSRRSRCSPCWAADLAWQATHQDQPLRWLRGSQVAPEPSGSAAFLLARQRAEGPFRIATAAPEPVLVHQLGAHRSRSARALLLDQEALRLGLEDVAGYNPVHLKRYHRLMLASNGGRARRPALRAGAAPGDAAAALAGGALLRVAAGRSSRRVCPSSTATG